jgi:hypothetical protein
MSHAGTAEVLDVTVKGSSLGDGFVKYELILEVRPDGEPPFRTKITHHFDLNFSPTLYDELKVRCDPASKAVEFETKGDPRYDPKAGKAAAKQRVSALLTGADPASASGQSNRTYRDDAEMAELEALERLELEARHDGD